MYGVPFASSKFDLYYAAFIALHDIVRKSKDYIYGIGVYKVLGIWKGYYRVKKSLVSCMKPWTEARNNKCMKYHSKVTYQLSFWNVSRKVDYHAGGKCYNGAWLKLYDHVNCLDHQIFYCSISNKVSWVVPGRWIIQFHYIWSMPDWTTGMTHYVTLMLNISSVIE